MRGTFYLITCCTLLITAQAKSIPIVKVTKDQLFQEHQIIFESEFDIYNIVAIPYKEDENGTINNSYFFNLVDKSREENVELGQFVFKNGELKKIFDGRTSSFDFETLTVFFGAKDGLFVYNKDKDEAVRYGTIMDNIKQLHKVQGEDEIYILTDEDHEVFKVTNNGTVKTKIDALPCVEQFVLDQSKNLFYICRDKRPYVLKYNALVPERFVQFNKIVHEAMLLRPPISTINLGVPFLVDGKSYMLHGNGSVSDPIIDFNFKPTSICADFGFVQYYAIDKKIYEFDVWKYLASFSDTNKKPVHDNIDQPAWLEANLII